MKIGELARRVGVSTDTVRYYALNSGKPCCDAARAVLVAADARCTCCSAGTG